MKMRRQLLINVVLVTFISINAWSITQIYNSKKASVKGISVSISPTPTSTPSPIITTVPSQTVTLPIRINPVVTKSVSQTKQYGGWYWNPVISKSQVWLGSDSFGNDIWADGLPTSASMQKANSLGTSTSSSGGAVSSGGNAKEMIRQTERKVITPK